MANGFSYDTIQEAKDAMADEKLRGYRTKLLYLPNNKYRVVRVAKVIISEPKGLDLASVGMALDRKEKYELAKRETALAKQKANMLQETVDREARKRLLPPEVETTLALELAARERRRIEAGVAPGREVGAIRWAGKVPMKVTPETAGAIGQREMTRLVKAQDILKTEENLKSEIDKLQDRKVELIGGITTEGEEVKGEIPHLKKEQELAQEREDSIAVQSFEKDIAKAKWNLELLEAESAEYGKAYTAIEKQVPKAKEMIAKGGAFTPTARTAMAIASRLESAKGEVAKGTTEVAEIVTGRKGVSGRAARPRSPVAGMRAIIPTSGDKPGYKHLAKIGITGAPRIAQAPGGGAGGMSYMGEARIVGIPTQKNIAQLPIPGEPTTMPRIAQIPTGKPRIANMDWMFRKKRE